MVVELGTSTQRPDWPPTIRPCRLSPVSGGGGTTRAGAADTTTARSSATAPVPVTRTRKVCCPWVRVPLLWSATLPRRADAWKLTVCSGPPSTEMAAEPCDGSCTPYSTTRLPVKVSVAVLPDVLLHVLSL